MPGAKQHRQPPLRVDPNAVPANMRSQPWSPEPDAKPARHASNASERIRRGSVPDRSPLQKLEYKLDDISKEEKRARMEEAEYRAAQRARARAAMPTEAQVGTARSEKPRIVSDGSRKPSQKQERERPRNASTGGMQSSHAQDGAAKMRQAQDALRNSPPKPVTNDGYFADRSQRNDTKVPDTRAYGGIERRAARQVPDAYAPAPAEKDKNEGGGVGRTQSGKYRHRARDAGFAGAAAAVSAGAATSAAERGKAAYERRKQTNGSADSAGNPASRERSGSFGRSNSKKLQKRPPPAEEWYGSGDPSFRGPQDQSTMDTRGQERGAQPTRGLAAQHGGKPLLQNDRMGDGAKQDKEAAMRYQEPDPISRERVKTGPNDPVSYSIPPQTAAGQQAREQVGFSSTAGAQAPGHGEKEHHMRDMFHRHHDERRGYQARSKPLDEWRRAGVLRLGGSDIDLEDAALTSATGGTKDTTWWESGARKPSTNSRHAPGQYEGAYEEEAQSFRPALFIKCGPLLRYTGIRREASGREVWRGSIMVVTEDGASDYSTQPVLRLFTQPMDLHQPLPPQSDSVAMAPEDEDPITGQVKVSRTGRPLYVRPVHDIEPSIDLSREENNHGLFSATRTPVLGPQSISGPEGRNSQHITFQNKSRIKRRDGERLNKYREMRAHRLHTERGNTFWRWNVEIDLSTTQKRIAYRINRGPALGFWVPARGETMNIMFHSCNGFSLSVDPDQFSGPDPLWRDVLNRHQHRPFHVMLGGGDQIYNDAAMRDTTLFKEWLQIKNPQHKHSAEFTEEMQDELEDFYLNRYAMWFSQGLFSMANSQIPMVNLWDDHDIIDGFGSYPHHFMSTRIFTGLGAVAFKYYMLFQHQSLAAETPKEEPSWLLGASPGPYINELSRSVFMSLGKHVAFLGLDCRTERMRDEILSQESYDLIFNRCRAEISKGETKHLIVLLGVPIAYPRLNFLENILTSKVMDPIKAIGRTGALGGFVNKFDGGVEILDDLDDHWTAKHHKAERNWFIQELQELAAEKSVRVTILGGDVHLGAVGQFYSNKKLGIPKDADHRYMPNIVSSAIVNTPPPPMMADVLNKRNKIHHLDAETDEDMIPMFDHDVDGSKRNNTHLLPRRNFAMIREYLPGTTPPPSPGLQPQDGYGQDERRFPPGSMKRTMSLGGRGPGGLIRRLSGSVRSKNPPMSLEGRPYSANNSQGTLPRRNSMSAAQDPSVRPTNQFHRRPTNMSIKEAKRAAAKGGADGNLDGREPGQINLQGGLDVSLCMEVDQRDPAGRTERYRLLVPALRYEGEGDVNTAPFLSRGQSFMNRFKGRRTSGQHNREMEMEEEDWSEGSEGGATPPPIGTGPKRQDSRRDELEGLQATAAGAGAGAGAVSAYPSRAVQATHAPTSTSQDPRHPQPQQPAFSGPGAMGLEGSRTRDPRGENPIRQQSEWKDYTAASPENLPPMQKSGYRRPSVTQRLTGMFRRKTNDRPPAYDDQYPYSDEDSLTPSEEEYDDRPLPPRGQGQAVAQHQAQHQAQHFGQHQAHAGMMNQRRPSKAERFFGINDVQGEQGAGGRRMSMQQGRPDLYQGGIGETREGDGVNEGAWEGRGFDGESLRSEEEMAPRRKGLRFWGR